MTLTRLRSDKTEERVLPGQTLAAARAAEASIRAGQVAVFELACEWADSHPVLDDEPHAGQGKAARREREALRVAERRRIAADWLGTMEPDSDFAPELFGDDHGVDPWLPEYAWDCAASFAAAVSLSTTAGGRLIDDALFVRARMPRLWRRTVAGEVEVWRARRIAQAGWRQPADVVDALDLEVTPRAHSIGVSGLDRVIDEINVRLHAEVRELDQIAALEHRHVTVDPEVTTGGLGQAEIRADLADVIAFDKACSAVAAALLSRQVSAGVLVPESLDVRRSRAVGILADPAQAQALLADPIGFDPDQLDPDRPMAPVFELVVHLTPEMVTAMTSGGSGLSLAHHPTTWIGRGARGALKPHLTQAVAEWCGREASQIRVQPVIDLTVHTSSTSRQVTASMRRRVALSRQTCVFPWCSKPSATCDADHGHPSEQGGSTCDCNLHPLCRHHHRLKTLSGWRYHPLPPADPDKDRPDSFIWTDAHQQMFLVDSHGTRPLAPDGGSGCWVDDPAALMSRL